MNKRGFIEMDEINPIAVIAGLVGGGVGIAISRMMKPGLIMGWITVIVVAVVCFFLVQKMSEN